MAFKKHYFLMALMLIIGLAFNIPCAAQPGDCDGNDVTEIADCILLTNYLFDDEVGPDQIDLVDCDCDGHPGVNFGDLIQLIGGIFGPATLYPSPGTDLPLPSHVKFFYNRQVPTAQVDFELPIYVKAPDGFAVESFILPFSYSAEAGQATLTCTGIEYEPQFSNCQFTIYPDDEIFVLYTDPTPPIPTAIPAGFEGLMCTVTFNSTGGADPNYVVMTATSTLSPLLYNQNYFDDINMERVYLPEIIRSRYGDANGDGSVNIADAVVIINFVFAGGAPPGNVEP